MTAPGGPRFRPAVRALLLDEDDHLLLVRFRWDGSGLPEGFWACPGGGIDPGETPEEALRRELHEELGLEDVVVQGALWRLTRTFPLPGWDGQAETWHLVRTARFAPAPTVDLAAEHVHDVRWFSLAELEREDAVLSPRDLVAQVARVLRDGVPASPHDIPALP